MLIRGAFRIAPMVIALAGAASTAAAQERFPADIAKEPHHRLLLENELVRVFAVTIPPLQETYVRHDHNFLTVALQDGEIVKWRGRESDVLHFPEKQGDARFVWRGVLGMRNETAAEYRDITVEFLDPRVTNYGYRWETGKWDFGSSAIAGPMDPHARFVNQLDLQRALVSDVQLLSKDSLDAPTQGSRELVIAVTPLELSNGNDASVRLAAGQVLWLNGRTSSLVNVGTGPARFVVVGIGPV